MLTSLRFRIVLALGAGVLLAWGSGALLLLFSFPPVPAVDTGGIGAVRIHGEVRRLVVNSFASLNRMMMFQAASPSTLNAIREFEEAAYRFNDDMTRSAVALRMTYRGGVMSPDGVGALYEQVRETQHDLFLQLSNAYELSDVALVESTEATVLFSLNMRDYFGWSLKSSQLRDSQFARVATAALHASQRKTFYSRFFKTGDGDTKIYLASPIQGGEENAGVIIIALSARRIIESLTPVLSSAGAIRVALISDQGWSMTAGKGAMPDELVRDLVKAALHGGHGVRERTDPAGTVRTTFGAVTIAGENFALITESRIINAPSVHALAPLSPAQIGLTLLVALLGALLVYGFLKRATLEPLSIIEEQLRNLARTGRLDAKKMPCLDADFGRIAELVADVADHMTERRQELETKLVGMQRYVETLEQVGNTKNNEPKDWKQLAALTQKEVDQSSQQVEQLTSEIEMLAQKLKRSSERLTAVDEEKRDFLSDVWPQARQGLSDTMDLAIRLGAVDLIPPLKKLDRSLDTACAGLAGIREVNESAFCPVDLSEVVTEMTRLYQPMATRKKVVLTYSSGTDEKMVDGDRESLGAAVACLIDNGLRYAGKEGTVALRVIGAGATVRLEVEDNGPGVAEKERRKIFRQFYRGEVGRKHNRQGMGLGLYALEQIVSRHHGSVDLSGSSDGGTLVTATLPEFSASIQRSLPGLDA